MMLLLKLLVISCTVACYVVIYKNRQEFFDVFREMYEELLEYIAYKQGDKQ